MDIETQHIAVSLYSLLGMCALSYSKPLMFSALILSISAVIDRGFFFLRFILKVLGCSRSLLPHVGLSLVGAV